MLPYSAELCGLDQLQEEKNIQQKKYDKLISLGNAGISVTNVDRIPERGK